MSFFEEQEQARRSTAWLVALYAAAVLGIVAAVDLALGTAYVWSAQVPSSLAAVPPGVYAAGALGTLAVILGVSGVQVVRLASGGEVVARMAGGRLVDPSSREPLERRLLDVVEEMAIASGVRVPAVYLLDAEPGINAFAAGHDVSHSVIAVTRGALETLNRDELQAVIGHEFSHILNGDMRLNLRMLGVLSGIVFIGSIGWFVLRGSRRTRERGAGGVIVFGIALIAIGAIGLFFAQLIKAAVSRQRELLADASSVQFTRNPDAIAGALDQIRLAEAGTLIGNRYAEEMSHMYFEKSAPALFATHPPIEERIRRVDPGFRPEEYRAARRPARLPDEPQRPAPAPEPSAAAARVLALLGPGAPRDEALQVIDRALPVLKGAAPEAKRDLLARAQAAALADGRVSMHEFVVLALLRDQLGGAPASPAGRKTLAELQADADLVVSLLVPGAGAQPTFAAVVEALDRLKRLAPLEKQELMRRLSAAAATSRQESKDELVRLVAAVLDCPVPPGASASP